MKHMHIDFHSEYCRKAVCLHVEMQAAETWGKSVILRFCKKDVTMKFL